MIRSLLNADVEERQRQRRKQLLNSLLVIALVVPAALGSVFPFLFFAWVAIGTFAVMLTESAPMMFVAMAASYLLISFIFWSVGRYALKINLSI